MKHLSNLINRCKNYFKPRVAFETLNIEQLATKNIPAEKKTEATIDLRFRAWLNYHKIQCTVFEKRKMRLAFHAGAHSIINIKAD